MNSLSSITAWRQTFEYPANSVGVRGNFRVMKVLAFFGPVLIKVRCKLTKIGNILFFWDKVAEVRSGKITYSLPNTHIKWKNRYDGQERFFKQRRLNFFNVVLDRTVKNKRTSTLSYRKPIKNYFCPVIVKYQTKKISMSKMRSNTHITFQYSMKLQLNNRNVKNSRYMYTYAYKHTYTHIQISHWNYYWTP